MTEQGIAEILKDARESCGFTIDYVARMIDVKPREIEKWERGDDLPSDAERALLARLYGIDPTVLFKTSDSTREEQASESFRTSESRSDGHTQEASGHNAWTGAQHDTYTTNDSRGNDTVFRSYLMVDEYILWSGSPDPAHSSVKMPFPTRIFMIFWLGFAVFWTIAASSAGGFFGIFGIPFILIGVYMNFGMHATEKKRKAGIYYAITNRRILFCGKGSEAFFNAITITPYLSVFYHAGKSGHGSIFLNSDCFSAQSTYDGYDDYSHMSARRRGYRRGNSIPQGPDPHLHLIDVADGEQVYRILQNAMEKSRF